MALVSAFSTYFASREPSTAASNSSFATKIVLDGATFVFAITNLVVTLPSWCIFRRYTAAAKASSDASENVCISVLVMVSSLGNRHLGNLTEFSCSMSFFHVDHQFFSSGVTSVSHPRPFITTAFNDTFALTTSGDAKPSGSKIPATRLSSPLRVNFSWSSVAILKVRMSEVGFQQTPKIFASASSARAVPGCTLKQ